MEQKQASIFYTMRWNLFWWCNIFLCILVIFQDIHLAFFILEISWNEKLLSKTKSHMYFKTALLFLYQSFISIWHLQKIFDPFAFYAEVYYWKFKERQGLLLMSNTCWIWNTLINIYTWHNIFSLKTSRNCALYLHL